MHRFTTLTSRTVVLPDANIDTDQIIPARFLTTTTRAGLGEHLFADWRYDEQRHTAAGFPAEPPGGRRLPGPGRGRATSAAAPRASTPRGRCSTTACAP